MTGADLRTAAVHIFLLFAEGDNKDLQTLLDTIVRVSCICYAFDSYRTPRTILQLYNCMWLHHETCTKLFPKTHSLRREKLFGSYLHDLSTHAAQQYEVVCLRSVNAECQERLFGQAKKIALNTTNRQAEHVIPEIMLRLQMKQREGSLLKSISNKHTKVQVATKHVPQCTGSKFSKSFLYRKRSSWQAHLERISSYLVHGPEVWWTYDNIYKTYHFHDADNDPDYHPEGPKLGHFRSMGIEDVYKRNRLAWNDILIKKIKLPAESITHDEEILTYSTMEVDQPSEDTEVETSTPPTLIHGTRASMTDESAQEPMDVDCEPGESQIKGLDVSSHSTAIPITTPQRQTVQPVRKLHTAHTIHHRLPENKNNKEDEMEENATLLEETRHTTTFTSTDDTSSTQGKVQSSTASAIAKAIGINDDVKQLDTIRARLQECSTCPIALQKEYDTIMAKLQTQLLTARRQKLDRLQLIEQDHFTEHNKLPNSKDSTSEYGRI